MSVLVCCWRVASSLTCRAVYSAEGLREAARFWSTRMWVSMAGRHRRRVAPSPISVHQTGIGRAWRGDDEATVAAFRNAPVRMATRCAAGWGVLLDSRLRRDGHRFAAVHGVRRRSGKRRSASRRGRAAPGAVALGPLPQGQPRPIGSAPTTRRYQKFLREQVTLAARSGMEGVHIDDALGAPPRAGSRAATATPASPASASSTSASTCRPRRNEGRPASATRLR